MISSLAAVMFSWFASVPPAAAQVVAGDVFVTDSRAGTDCTGRGVGCGALFRVDPTTGQRTLVSDFGNPAQGPLGRVPFAAAFDTSGLLVLDQWAGTDCTGQGIGCGALFRVDTTTGVRLLLSDFGNPGQGPTGLRRLYDIAVDSSGTILVTDQAAGTAARGTLFLVDPTNGTRTVLSDFGNDTQGPLGGNPSGVAVEATGRILVVDPAAELFPTGVLFTVDQGTGQRSVLSDFNDAAQGPLGQIPIDVWPASNGQLWVLDQLAFTTGGGGLGKLFRVDGTTGARTVVSDLSTSTQGPISFNANALDVTAASDVLIVDMDAGTNGRGALFRVNPTTGQRVYVSDFGNPAQGPLGEEPSGLVIARPQPPAPATLTVSKQGTGSGVVTSNLVGINCGTDCTETYVLAETVTLTATPDAGSTFSGWSGDADCSDGVVEMTADRQCTATFQLSFSTQRLPDLTWSTKDTALSREFFWESPAGLALPASMSIDLGWANKGPGPSPATLSLYYLSRDNKLGADDTLLVSGFPGGGYVIGAMPPGGTGGRRVLGLFEIPSLPPGRYYIIGVLDGNNAVAETREQNNTIALRFTVCPGAYAGENRC